LNQQWDIIYDDEYPEEPKKGELNKDYGLFVQRPFYIVSQLPDNRYLDLINTRQMVIKVSNGRNTQQWYFDQTSLTIKSKSNNQSFDIQNAGRTANMQVWTTNSQWFQIFKYMGETFVNVQNHKLLEVKAQKDLEGQSVGVGEGQFVTRQMTKEEKEEVKDSKCYKTRGNIIKGCTCHPSCSTCGYNGNPVREIDCITC